jgi:hypothetical protein
MKEVKQLSRIEVERVELETAYINACAKIIAADSEIQAVIGPGPKRSAKDQALDSVCDAMARVNTILGGSQDDDVGKAGPAIEQAVSRPSTVDTVERMKGKDDNDAPTDESSSS